MKPSRMTRVGIGATVVLGLLVWLVRYGTQTAGMALLLSGLFIGLPLLLGMTLWLIYEIAVVIHGRRGGKWHV